MGAQISEYLLEKSRIVSQTSDERNYHIFYELLCGLTDEQKQRYGLLESNKYFYLNQVSLNHVLTNYAGNIISYPFSFKSLTSNSLSQ